MPARACQVCESRPADLLISLTETGASEFVCLPCTPFRVVEYFAQAGVPGLQFGFAEDRMGSDAPEPDQAGPVSIEGRPRRANKSGPRRQREAPPESEAEAPPAGNGRRGAGVDAEPTDGAG